MSLARVSSSPAPTLLRSLAAVVLLVVVLAGAGAIAHGASPPTRERAAQMTPGCPVTPMSPGDHVVRIRVDATLRSALVHIPARSGNGPAPLLLAFHGWGASGRFMASYSGLSSLADRAGFIAAYPDAAGAHRAWSVTAGSPAGQADVEFTIALLDALRADTCIDPRRISALGVSNGGGFVARLGCTIPDRLAGMVIVAGSVGSVAACPSGPPVSVLEIHGTEDAIVPYRGRPGSRSVTAWLAGWVARDGCAAAPTSRVVAPRVRRFAWAPCRAATVVNHLRISEGRHQWPGATPPDPGPVATISATRAAWSFLAPRRLAVTAG